MMKWIVSGVITEVLYFHKISFGIKKKEAKPPFIISFQINDQPFSFC